MDSRYISEEKIKKIISMGKAKQTNIQKISKKVGASYQTVKKYLELNGIKTRTKGRKKTDYFNFGLNRKTKFILKNLGDDGRNKTKWINHAIELKNLLENNPKELFIRMKKDKPKLFRFINRKYGKGMSPEERNRRKNS